MRVCLLALLLVTSCFAQAVGTSGAIGISVASGGGTPASPVNSIQFNLAGAFGGSANLGFYPTAITTPAAPTVTNIGAAGATTYGYLIVARNLVGLTLQGPEGQTLTGNAVLDGTNYNHLAWPAVVGAVSYDVYLWTPGGNTPSYGWIANVLTNSYNHQGQNGDFTYIGNDANTTVGMYGSNAAISKLFVGTPGINQFHDIFPRESSMLSLLSTDPAIGGLYASINIDSSDDITVGGQIFGHVINVLTAPSQVNSFAGATALSGDVDHYGAGVLTGNLVGISFGSFNENSNSPLAIVSGINGQAYNYGVAVKQLRGFWAQAVSASGASELSAGYYAAEADVAGSTLNAGYYSTLNAGKWAFYGAGTAASHFGGVIDAAGGSANLGVCWKADGKTLGNGTIAEITAGTCH